VEILMKFDAAAPFDFFLLVVKTN